MALVLIGFMGAGKTTLADRLAAARGSEARDSDALLEQRFGHPVAVEFERHGEQAFREAEEALVGDLLSGAGARDVIALGGGAVLSERTRDALAGHLVALVDVDVQVAWDRVHGENEGSDRPLARDREAFGVLYDERRELYQEVADARLLWAESASGDYPVLVGHGLLRADLAAIWPLDRSRSRAFCVSDQTVFPIETYGELLGELAGSVLLAPGEEHKTLASAERVWQAMVDAGITRADHVVALGGGVVGDLAGFCAATYQRGVPIVHVPTTLVAQVDSAYGGKTGVDLPAAKNYVGAYHQPAGVIVDPDTLATLPAGELASGWVEVLKTALIAGGALWERVSAMDGCAVDDEVICDCAATKLALVRADERDGGRRQLLNLGHTVGHAIETATGYARYRHGEAVGLGLLASLRLSGAGELREQVAELLAARGLPVTLGGARAGGKRGRGDAHGAPDVDAIVAATAHDKKRLGRAAVPFVLARAPGRVEIGQRVSETELRAAVAELVAP